MIWFYLIDIIYNFLHLLEIKTVFVFLCIQHCSITYIIYNCSYKDYEIIMLQFYLNNIINFLHWLGIKNGFFCFLKSNRCRSNILKEKVNKHEQMSRYVKFCNNFEIFYLAYFPHRPPSYLFFDKINSNKISNERDLKLVF